MSTFVNRLLQAARHIGSGERQTDIAIFIGLPIQTVNQWFVKGYVPKRDLMARIARAYGVDIGWLTDGEGEMVPSPSSKLPADERELLRNYRTATPKTKEQIRSVVRSLRKVAVVIAVAMIPPLLPDAELAPSNRCVYYVKSAFRRWLTILNRSIGTSSHALSVCGV